MSISGGTLTGLIQDKERLLILIYNAEVAELVDAHDSGSCGGNPVVSTIDPAQSIIELIISPDYLEDTRQLVSALSKEVYIRKIENLPGLI